MAFVNPLFLLALSAAAAPIIIHLIFRLRRRVVTFGSLRFLQRLVKKNRRRLRLRDILLMLLRVAAISLVALAFARPYFSGAETAAGERRHDVVFVLDDSFSMSAGRLARTNFDEARAHVLDALSNLRKGDRAALVVTSGGGMTVAQLTTSMDSVASRARAAAITYERAQLAPALRVAAGLLAASDEETVKRVAVASDLQRTSWTEAALAAVAAAGVTYESILPPAGQANLAVVGAEAVTEVWAPGVPVRVRARIANYGDEDAKAVPVRLRVGTASAPRAPRATRSVDVPAGQEVAVELAFDAAAAGEFPATVEIDGADAIGDDDVRHLVLRLRGQLRVLLVMDEMSGTGSRFGDEDYFVRRALDPRMDPADPPASDYEPMPSRSELLDAAGLRSADAVMLLGAGRLSVDSVRQLADWVRGGGRLLIAPFGGRTPAVAAGPAEPDGAVERERAFFNQRLGAAGLLPARVGDLVATNPQYPQGFRITSWDPSHPVFAPFRDGRATGPDRGRALSFRKLIPLEGSRVLARIEPERPAVVERSVGEGVVVQLAFGLTAAATDLPKHKAFVPFVHGLVAYLTRAKEEARAASVEVGAPLPLTDAFAGPRETGERAELVSPDGVTMPVAAAGASVTVLAERPGFYELRLRRRGMTEVRPFAVNVPAVESDLRGGDLSDHRAFLAALAAGIDESRETAEKRPSSASYGASKNRGPREPSSIWAWLLGAVAVMLLAESLLANRVVFRTRSLEGAEPEETAEAEEVEIAVRKTG